MDIQVQSGYGARERQPFVQLVVGDTTVLLTPSKASAIGQWLIEASAAAVCDAALVRVLGGEKLTIEEAAAALTSFRDARVAIEREDTPA